MRFFAAQHVLDDTIAAVEADQPLAVQPLTPTVGDEQQGVYRELGDAMTALLMIQLRLPDGIAFRFGIGVGEVRAVASVHGELADGPGWYAGSGGTGFGLRSVRRRLELVYADRAQLEIVKRDGVAVELTLPW